MGIHKIHVAGITRGRVTKGNLAGAPVMGARHYDPLAPALTGIALCTPDIALSYADVSPGAYGHRIMLRRRVPERMF